MVSLIRSLVGTQAKIVMKEETIEGRILGMENLGEKEYPFVSVYLSGGILGTYSLDRIENVCLMEEQVRQDINFSLDLTKNESKDDMQKLSVFYSNVDLPKKLIARYGFKVSEWKSSYRMTCFKDNPTRFMLHGLAIIENSLWEDWNDVKVTLVVGAPAIHTKTEESDEGVWNLVIKTLDGSSMSIRANPKDSVLSVKSKIAKKKGTSPFSFKLVFCGKNVEDGRQLSDYTISNNAVLHMTKVDGRSDNQSSGTTSQVNNCL